MSEASKLLWTILNILMLSIPEEAFIVIFTLIVLNRYDLLEWKWTSIRRLMLPVLIPAISSNIFRTYFNFDMLYMPFYMIFIISLCLVLVYKLEGFKEIIKTICCVLLSVFIPMLLQTFYIPIVLYGTSITLKDMNTPGWMIPLLGIPERVTELLLVIFLFIRKNTFSKINIISTIIQSATLSLLSVITLLYNIVFLYFMALAIYNNMLLYGLPPHLQLLILAAVVMSPLISLSILITVVVYISDKEAREKFRIQEELMVSIKDIQFFLKRKEYEKIHKELHYLERDAKALYKN